jgi:hypothetical protein
MLRNSHDLSDLKRLSCIIGKYLQRKTKLKVRERNGGSLDMKFQSIR